MTADGTANPPGQSRLRRRVDTHATALARMRAELADRRHDLAVRSLAAQDTDEVAVALLDGWAVVADIVAFYSERIATEGFLRTATELRSVRELARTLGYRLRPGVAAQADLAFTAETAPGAPAVATVAAGTPVQSVPGPGQLPQTFETMAELEARGVWSSLPAIDSEPQVLTKGDQSMWLRGPAGTVQAGDSVLIRGVRADMGPNEQRQLRRVLAVEAAPGGLDGWLHVELDEGITFVGPGQTSQTKLVDIGADSFGVRTRLFGWNAPDPNLLVVDGSPPPGTTLDQNDEPIGPPYEWADYAVVSPLELDGEHDRVLPGSWLVLRQGSNTEICEVVDVVLDGAAKWTLSGPVTVVTPDPATGLSSFGRHRAGVLCGSEPLAASEQPDFSPLSGTVVTVAATDPPLPPGRRVMLRGIDHASRLPLVETATVADCVLADDGMTMDLELAAPLDHAFARQGLEVLANVVVATHGESLEQVLGSGDGRAGYASFPLRRAPLTYVRDSTPDGARAELTVRVDGVAWTEVGSLDEAGPDERVYAVHHDDDGACIVTGDGKNGARPASGQENITAAYRVGIGLDGAVDANQLALLPSRPFGIRSVTNPAPAQDWAPPETIEQARANAPLRARTFDRAVSVSDYEDVARGYAGVGPARADLVWDGRRQRVLVSVLGTGASAPSGDLIGGLRESIEAARDPACPLDVLAGTSIWFGLRVEVATDEAYERPAVLDAIGEALNARFGADITDFAVPVTPSAVLVAVREVPGVVACTMPRLFPIDALPEPPLAPVLPPDNDALDVVPAQPGRWDGGPLPAQLLALAPGGLEIEEMVT